MPRFNTIFAYIAAVFVLFAVAVAAPTGAVVYAYDPLPCGTACDEIKDDGLTIGATDFKGKNITNTALQVLGSVAVITTVVGAMRITLAHGDPSQVKAGRETVLYSVIGLIVALSAYAIINFVFSLNW